MIKEKITAAAEKCINGIVLNKEEIIELLDIPVGSEDDDFLRHTAKKVALKKTEGKGYIWTAVGMDFSPCEMNCKFCSFGEQWNLIKEKRYITIDEIIENFRRYANDGAAFIILRTTEFYSIDKLLSYLPEIRKKVPGSYKIVFNTGEITPEIAQKLADGGVYGVYHALRLREGEDTPFVPLLRINTMKNVSHSPLKLISLTEPIGPEHSNEEIADNFLNTVHCGAVIGGAMARFPVPGTPLGNTKMITDEQLAHIIAVLRLSGGDVIKNICSNPGTALTMQSGGNIVVVESGAIPRDVVYSEEDWADANMEKARNLLTYAGFAVSHIGN